MIECSTPYKIKNNSKFEKSELIEIINYIIDENLIPDTSFAFKFFGICNKEDSLNLISNATDQFFYNNFSDSFTLCTKVGNETFFLEILKFDTEYAFFPLGRDNHLELSNNDKKSLIKTYEFIINHLDKGYYKNEKL